LNCPQATVTVHGVIKSTVGFHLFLFILAIYIQERRKYKILMFSKRVCCNETGNCHLVCMNSFQTGTVKATVEIVCCVTVQKVTDVASQVP